MGVSLIRSRFAVVCAAVVGYVTAGAGLSPVHAAMPGLQVAQSTVAAAAVSQTDIVGPPGSGSFGQVLRVLPNGNLVVSDRLFDLGGIPDVGAVYLYNGATNALISRVTGSASGDMVGSRVDVLSATSPNANSFVISTSTFDNGGVVDVGAVTWVNGATGLNGEVSAANSLIEN